MCKSGTKNECEEIINWLKLSNRVLAVRNEYGKIITSDRAEAYVSPLSCPDTVRNAGLQKKS